VSEDTHNSPPANRGRFWIDWSWRRRRLFVGYIFIGSLLGFILPIVVPIFVMMVCGLSVRTALAPLMAVPTTVLSAVLSYGLILALLASGAKGTCSKSPVAPSAAAIGAVIGGGVFSVFALLVVWSSPASMWRPIVTMAAFALPPGMAWAIVWGGKRGLLRNLGALRQGIGVLCAKCGYDLEATREHWPCPECGGKMRYERKAIDLEST
jgi:hypothetical protein